MLGPYKKLIIVASWGQLVLIMEAPFKSANFLLVPKQFSLIRLLSSDISYQDASIPTPTCNNRPIPWWGAYSVRMACKGSDFLPLIYVPYLNFSKVITNTEMRSSLGPRNTSDWVIISEITKLGYRGSTGVPYVNSLTKSYCQDVWVWPIH
jgi:hypothetical protein